MKSALTTEKASVVAARPTPMVVTVTRANSGRLRSARPALRMSRMRPSICMNYPGR
jgi:hypothetical protein